LIGPSALAGGTLGSLSAWDSTTGTAASLTVGPHNPLCTLNTPVSIGAVTYTAGVTSNAIRLNNNSNFTYTGANIPGSHRKVSVGMCITLGAVPTSTNLMDLVVFRDELHGKLAELQLRNNNQLNVEAIVNGSTLHTANFITVPDGATLWCTVMVDPANTLGAANPQMYASCYNPTPPYAQVGSSLALQLDPAWVNTTKIRIGDGEVGTASGKFTSFEMILFDYTNGVYPLGVGTLSTLWAGILSPTRAIDWSSAGAGVLPARATICTTLGTAGQSSAFAQSVTATQINNAIAGCGADRTVFLNPGTYTIGPISFTGTNNVTLRGAGADQTILVATGTTGPPCTAQGAFICLAATDNNFCGSPGNCGKSNAATWSAGYTPGSNVVTLSAVPNLKIGGMLFLDQLDEACDTGTIIVSDATSACTATSPGINGPYSLEGNGNNYHVDGRQSLSIVQVVGCNGNTTAGTSCTGTNVAVTISPAIRWAHYRSAQTPQAWWPTNPIHGDGVENLTVDMGTNGVSNSGIQIKNGYGNWVKGVAILNTQRAHLQLVYGLHNTFRDSYIFLTQNAATQSYGYDCLGGGGDNLVENNIFHAVEGSVKENGCMGDVLAYNFSINQYYTASPRWSQPCMSEHTAGTAFNLYEGNQCSHHETDLFHGTHFFATTFRNWFWGQQPVCYLSGASYATSTYTSCNNNLHAARNEGFSRFFNHVGNIFGRPGFTYTYTNGAQPDIYDLGDGNGLNDDPHVITTMMRWGNFDLSTSTTRFQSSEVPSALTLEQARYANLLPGSQTLPASFYLSAKPSWWPAAKPWPAAGPDVTGGNVSGVGGRVYTLPAQDCYTSLGGNANGTGPQLTNFNADACY
jgi:hypothetical protein